MLVRRVERLRAIANGRRLRRRSSGLFSSEGVLFDDGAILGLQGVLDHRAVPHIEALLDRVIGRGLSLLRIDISEASRLSRDALAVIELRRSDVDHFEVRLPPGADSDMPYRLFRF